jgi:hypothetical protein
VEPSEANDDLETHVVEEAGTTADPTTPDSGTADSASSSPMAAKTLIGALVAAVLAGFLLLAIFSSGDDQAVDPSD